MRRKVEKKMVPVRQGVPGSSGTEGMTYDVVSVSRAPWEEVRSREDAMQEIAMMGGRVKGEAHSVRE